MTDTTAMAQRRRAPASRAATLLRSRPPNPYRVPRPAVISFSGGRTSGYLLKHVIDAYGGRLPEGLFVAFANTGMERPETLGFVHICVYGSGESQLPGWNSCGTPRTGRASSSAEPPLATVKPVTPGADRLQGFRAECDAARVQWHA